MSFAAATTQRLNGVPWVPATCLRLSVLQARDGLLVVPWAILAIAVTQRENGVPFSPATCLRLILAQYLPVRLGLGRGRSRRARLGRPERIGVLVLAGVVRAGRGGAGAVAPPAWPSPCDGVAAAIGGGGVTGVRGRPRIGGTRRRAPGPARRAGRRSRRW